MRISELCGSVKAKGAVDSASHNASQSVNPIVGRVLISFSGFIFVDVFKSGVWGVVYFVL